MEPWDHLQPVETPGGVTSHRVQNRAPCPDLRPAAPCSCWGHCNGGLWYKAQVKKKIPNHSLRFAELHDKRTGSKASDSPGCAGRRMGISHRYTQTRSCKPSSGKPRELQTRPVSTSESIFLPEILPNTPLSLRAKPKPCFVSLPCITVDSRWVFFAHGSRVKKQTVLLRKLLHQDTP